MISPRATQQQKFLLSHIGSRSTRTYRMRGCFGTKSSTLWSLSSTMRSSESVYVCERKQAIDIGKYFRRLYVGQIAVTRHLYGRATTTFSLGITDSSSYRLASPRRINSNATEYEIIFTSPGAP